MGRYPAPAPEYKLRKTPGNLSCGKLGKLFVRLKLGLIGPSTSLRVEQSSSFGLGLGLNWLCFG